VGYIYALSRTYDVPFCRAIGSMPLTLFEHTMLRISVWNVYGRKGRTPLTGAPPTASLWLYHLALGCYLDKGNFDRKLDEIAS